MNILKRILRKTAQSWYRWEEVRIRDKSVWEREYLSGVWDFLNTNEESPRYAIIESWHKEYKPEGSVLDVGCGEGILLNTLCRTPETRYLGLDVSTNSIDRAKKKIINPSAEGFLSVDLHDFLLAGREPFDVIVFNEVLYYCRDYLSQLKRYEEYLKPKGIFIISIYHSYSKIWGAIDNVYKQKRLQALYIKVLNSRKRWNLGVYQF